jgi:hypothetical protein
MVSSSSFGGRAECSGRPVNGKGRRSGSARNLGPASKRSHPAASGGSSPSSIARAAAPALARRAPPPRPARSSRASSASRTSSSNQCRACARAAPPSGPRRGASRPARRSRPRPIPARPPPAPRRHRLGKAGRVLRAAAQQPQRAGVIGAGALGGGLQLAIGLVDHDQVGASMMPRLTPCNSSPPAGRHQQHEDVRHLRHHGFGLAHAHGLDQHHVEARRLAQRHRLARAPGDAAQMRLAGRGADEGVRARASRSIRVLSPRIEPPVRAEDGSTASTATAAPSHSIMPKASMKVDLPTPGVPDSPSRSASRPWPATRQQRRACVAVIGAGALHQRDRARQRPAVGVQDARWASIGGHGASVAAPSCRPGGRRCPAGWPGWNFVRRRRISAGHGPAATLPIDPLLPDLCARWRAGPGRAAGAARRGQDDAGAAGAAGHVRPRAASSCWSPADWPPAPPPSAWPRRWARPWARPSATASAARRRWAGDADRGGDRGHPDPDDAVRPVARRDRRGDLRRVPRTLAQRRSGPGAGAGGARALRPDLRLLVMSATLDAAPVAALMGDAPVLTAEGRAFRSRRAGWTARCRARRAWNGGGRSGPAGGGRDRGRRAGLPARRGRDPARRAAALSGRLPGRARCTRFTARCPSRSSAPPSPPQGRKLVLATAIAETSLTIEDIRVVVDAGRRGGRATIRLGHDAAGDRARQPGRGRAAPRPRRAGGAGVCYRLWTRGRRARCPPIPRPRSRPPTWPGWRWNWRSGARTGWPS